MLILTKSTSLRLPSCVSWLRGRHRVMRTLGHHDEKYVHLCDEPSEGSLAQAGKWAQYVCLCTGTAISSIPWILHTSGGTFTSRGLWRNWVGGDWLFLNKRGGAGEQSPAASLHQLVASSPGHMPAHTDTHTTTDVVSWLIKTFGHRRRYKQHAQGQCSLSSPCMHM